MGARGDEGTRHFTRMINSPRYSQVDFIYIIYTQQGCPRFDIYRGPVYFFDYIKSQPPKLHFFVVSFVSADSFFLPFVDARIDCLADCREIRPALGGQCFYPSRGIRSNMCRVLQLKAKFSAPVKNCIANEFTIALYK